MRTAGVPEQVLNQVKEIGPEKMAEQKFFTKLEAVVGRAALEQRLGNGQQVGALILQRVERIKNWKCLERSRMPLRQLITHPSTLASPPARAMFDDVMKEFQEIGRTAASSKRMLDSISKEDLMKVLQRVAPNRLLPNFIEQLKNVCDEFISLIAALKEAEVILPMLEGEAGVKFAKLRESLAPLFNDLQLFFKGDGSFKPDLLLGDVTNLRAIKLSEAMDLLGEVQQKVDAALAAAADDANKAELERAKKGLGDITQRLAALSQKLDAALAPLRLKLGEVETWFDTVMQSFEERYNRGMKTVAFVISLIVAILLNANIFGIYRDIAADPRKREEVLKMSDVAMASFKASEEKKIQDEVKKANDIANDNTKSEKEKETAEKNARDQIRKILEENKTEIDKNTAIFGGFGFTPLKADWAASQGRGTGAFIFHMLYMLAGWLLMAALLSVGAPFWNDMLQSLFGIKNLLRKQGDIKNVEQEAGAGQPKP